MTTPRRPTPRLSRRRLLQTALLSGACFRAERVLGQAPAVITSDRTRPQLLQGMQIGDVVANRAVVWCRADRPSRLVVEHAVRANFADVVRVRGPLARASDDFVARVDLTGLPPDRDIFLRVAFEDLDNGRTRSIPLEGRFHTAPARRRDVRFVWSGDTAGQGFGINLEWGGMRIYEAMRALRPDFFIHCGDTIYADGPIEPTVPLADGTVWKNLVTEETSKVAESLGEFRGRYKYNLLDEHVRRFSAEVPQLWQWDDHEVVNNWSDAKDLTTDERYTEKNVRVLAGRALQAFLEYAPMRSHGLEDTERVYRHIPYGPTLDVLMLDGRSYRSPNSYNRQTRPGSDTAFLGVAQLTWLKESLRRSTATWKVISSDMPIGLVVPDGQDSDKRDMFEAVANGDGPARGREFEIADLLSFIKRERIRNVVWVTADVHYTAAHHYDPARADYSDFDPFWEFVSGPLHAGSFGPSALDSTFGPQVVFQKAAPVPNAPPSDGFQFFGQADIDGRTGALTVTLKDAAGASVFSRTIEPAR